MLSVITMTIQRDKLRGLKDVITNHKTIVESEKKLELRYRKITRLAFIYLFITNILGLAVLVVYPLFYTDRFALPNPFQLVGTKLVKTIFIPIAYLTIYVKNNA